MPNSKATPISLYPPNNLKMEHLSQEQTKSINSLYVFFKSFFDILDNANNEKIKKLLSDKIYNPWILLKYSSKEAEVYLYNTRTKILANLSFKPNSWDDKSDDPDQRVQKYYQFSLYNAPIDDPALKIDINTKYADLKNLFLYAYPSILLNPDYFTIDKSLAPNLLSKLSSEANLHLEMNKEQQDYILGKIINRHKINLLKSVVENIKPSRFCIYAQELHIFSSIFGQGDAYTALLAPCAESQSFLQKSLFAENLMGHLYYCQNNIKNKIIYWDPVASKTIKPIEQYTAYETNSYGLLVEQLGPQNWKGYGYSWLSLFDAPEPLAHYLENLNKISPSEKDAMLSFEIKDGKLVMLDDLFQECQEVLFDSLFSIYDTINPQDRLTPDQRQRLPFISYENILTCKQKNQLEELLPPVSPVSAYKDKESIKENKNKI